jgi:hypothetical protein
VTTVYRLDRWIQQGMTWSVLDLDGPTIEALEVVWSVRQRIETERLERQPTGSRGESF